MKLICVLTTRHNCDDNRIYHKEVKTLADAGYSVLYIAPNNTDKGYQNVTYESIPLVPRKKLKPVFKHVYELITKKYKVESVHFHDPEILPFACKIKRRTKIKVIYDVHEDYKSEMLIKLYLSKIEKKLFYTVVSHYQKKADKKFDAIVNADNFVAEEFHNKNKIILFNYPDVSNLPETYVKDIRERNDFDIIFPGTINPFIFKMMMDMTRICREKGHPIRCCIITEYRYKKDQDDNLAYMESSGVNKDDVTLLPRIPTKEVPLYLNRTKLGIAPLPDNPKFRKNIATKMFEYMYYYLPVLTSDLPPAKQYLDVANSGYLIKYDDAEAYADKIIYLLNNPDVANEMGKTGHDKVASSWNWSTEKEKLIELYKTLLG